LGSGDNARQFSRLRDSDTCAWNRRRSRERSRVDCRRFVRVFYKKTQGGNAEGVKASGIRAERLFLSRRERGLNLKFFATEGAKKTQKNKLLTTLKSALRIII